MYGWFDFGSSSNAGIFGQSALCGPRGKKEWWRVYIIRPLWNVGHSAHRLKWYLQHRFNPKHQYHLIDTGLEPGYYDVDYLMLHGCFSLLCRYVEDEQGGVEKLTKWSENLMTAPDKNAPEGLHESQGENESEAVKLYLWWKRTKPADQAEYDRMVHHLYSDKWVTYTNDDGHRVFGPRRKWTDEDIAMRSSMHALDDKMKRDEQEMLKRLIDIRGGLWT